jgi:hypothetical protein
MPGKFSDSCVMMYGWTPAELWLATKCCKLERVAVKGPHEMSGFGLSCSLKRWRESSVVHNLYLMVCTQLWIQLYLRVGTQLLLLGHASSCRHPLNGTKTIN